MRLRTAPTQGRSGWPATVLPPTHGGPARRGLGAPYSAAQSTLVPRIEKFGDPSRFHSGRTPSISCVSRIDGSCSQAGLLRDEAILRKLSIARMTPVRETRLPAALGIVVLNDSGDVGDGSVQHNIVPLRPLGLPVL